MAHTHLIEPLSKNFLTRLNDGVTIMRFEVAYPDVQGNLRTLCTLWAMATIGAGRDFTQYLNAPIGQVAPLEDFVYSLGYCQLYAFFELTATPR